LSEVQVVEKVKIKSANFANFREFNSRSFAQFAD